MKQDITTIRQSIQRESNPANQSELITKLDAREKSDLSAVRLIIQRNALLGKPAKQVVKPAVRPKQQHAPIERTDQFNTPPAKQPKTTIEPDSPEKTKPTAPGGTVRENNAGDSKTDSRTKQFVEEEVILDMLKSAVNKIDMIADSINK